MKAGLIFRCVHTVKKTIIIFVMVTVCKEKFASNSTDFNEVLYSIFWKSVEEIQFLLKHNKNNG